MDIIVFTIVTVLLTWLINRWRTREYVRVAFKWPSNRLHTWLGWGPILGSKNAQTYAWDYASKYGSDSVLWSGPLTLFLTSTPETIQDIFTSSNCVDKPSFIYGGLKVLIGRGLINNSNPDWSRHRKVFDKAFSNKNLYAFTPIFHKHVSNTINYMERSLKFGKSIDMLAICRELTFRTSFTTTFKRDIEHTSYSVAEIINYFHGFLIYGAEVCFNQMLKIKFIRFLTAITIYREIKRMVTTMHKIVLESIVTAKRNDRNDSSYVADIVGVVDYGLTAVEQNVLTFDEMKDSMEHIVAGAVETTSTTLFSVICMLAMHHEWQERVYEEVINWMPYNDNENGTIIFDQVNQLVYLNMVLNETIRLLPPVPVVFRTISNQNLKLSNGGHILPVGQIIAIDIYRLHRNKDVWGPDADRFNPENFSPENAEQRHPYAFIPFTKGKRFCIGSRYAMLSLKIALAEIIKNFKFDTDFKFEDIQIRNHVTIQFVEEPKIKVERRVPKTFEMKA